MSGFAIAGRAIGDGAPCFVIAEAGVNHNGRVELALKLIDVAAEAGADAVKFQTFRPERLASPQAEKAAYQKATTGAGESQLDLLRRLAFSDADFAALKRHCERRGILFLSSPFDEESVDFLDRLGVAAFKIPSGEVVNTPLLARIGAKRKPVILSTGMATLAEVEGAVTALAAAGCTEMAILQCVSNYPAEPADANLRAMDTLAAAFGRPVGYSDHTLGLEVALASVARGAAVLEKHFTLDKSLPGPDHRCSLEPAELRALMRGVRAVEAALGSGRKAPAAAEADVAAVARRSLFLRGAVAAGTMLEAGDLIALRPGDGIGPGLLPQIVGRRTRRALPAGHKLGWEDLA
ncbi:MAG TPA: N-acetylneuraminate synthase [Stellaceae bacterium]|nr:N-acetylneuraminate synthase [Stellaceae bacterium]